MSLGGTFLITNTPSIYEAEEFDRHVLHHQYSLHWGNWRVCQICSWSPILPPLKELKRLRGKFLITNTPSIEVAEEIERQIFDHQHSLHWRSWRDWGTISWSPILPPLKKLKSLTDTLLITNTASIGGTNEFERHVLDDQYTLHLWSWRVWPTRSSSPILPQLVKLKSLTGTFLITNTPSIKSAEEFGRHVLDNQYSLHWRRCSIWQTRSWSAIISPLKRLKSLADTFLIINTPSIEVAEEFDRHVLDHQYFLHWRS